MRYGNISVLQLSCQMWHDTLVILKHEADAEKKPNLSTPRAYHHYQKALDPCRCLFSPQFLLGLNPTIFVNKIP